MELGLRRPRGEPEHAGDLAVTETFDLIKDEHLAGPGRERRDGPLEVDAAIRPADDDFVDPELRRGDLLLMNMHLWHRAEANGSKVHRVGVFNKYAQEERMVDYWVANKWPDMCRATPGGFECD